MVSFEGIVNVFEKFGFNFSDTSCHAGACRQRVSAERLLSPVDDYTVANVSEKVARILLSYTDYVKRVVWGSAGGGVEP